LKIFGFAFRNLPPEDLYKNMYMGYDYKQLLYPVNDLISGLDIGCVPGSFKKPIYSEGYLDDRSSILHLLFVQWVIIDLYHKSSYSRGKTPL
jgi:hypothetical protein